MNLIVIIFLASILLGVLAGEFAEELKQVNILEEGLDRDKPDTIKETHSAKYGVGWITEQKNETIYSFNKPNISGKADKTGIEPFYIETNSRGLRDERFEKNKSEGKVRILVLGTSSTLGYGVERENTYVEIVEKNLQDESQKDVQVLNAGSPGYGMKDFYLYLRERGIRYEPDIVVIAFDSLSWRSREKSDELNKYAAEKLRETENFENLSKVERMEKTTDYVFNKLKKEVREKGIEETDMRYIENIHNLTSENEINSVFYSLHNLNYPGQKEYVERWAKTKNKSIYYAPKSYRNDFSSEVRNSKWDNHPNEKGHQIISNRLASVLRKNYRDDLE